MGKASIFESIHEMAPTSTPYSYGRRFKDRIFFRGLFREARVFAKSVVTTNNQNKRFLIVARARSGTKLLTRLLDSHSAIRCDREIFNRNLLYPVAYFDRLAASARADAYGAKMLTDHMVLTQRMHKPDEFLEQMVARDVALIHLERSSLTQTISGMVAKLRGQLHSDRGGKTLDQKIYLDPHDFICRLQWSEALLQYEKAALKDVPHLHISYEKDLLGSEAQNRTVARICKSLDLPGEYVGEPLKKLLPKRPEDTIQNFSEICDAIADNELSHLLPETYGKGP